jgi:hypothetical protein
MAPCRGIVSVVAVACLVSGNAGAEDKIDALLHHGQLPADMIHPHGYSDFTDPLGRFLDLLAAGAFDEARLIQPDACAVWAATRQTSAFSGRFWVWSTEIDLDTLCGKF